MLPDSFMRLGLPGGPWLEKRSLRRESLPPADGMSVELNAFERYARAQAVSILHMGDDRFLSWCRLARIATGAFGTVSAAIDDHGDVWVVKKLRRTHYVWAQDRGRAHKKPSDAPPERAPKPPATDDHTLARELEMATRFAGGGRWAPMAFCTPTRAYLVARAARGDLADVMLMPQARHGQGVTWAEQTLMFALADVCGDLAEVHLQGMVHNDIKANNVLLLPGDGSGAGRFFLSDFGMAFSPRLGETSATHATLGAPEVLAAEAGSCGPFYDLMAADDQCRWRQRQRGDIWSLGLMGVSRCAASVSEKTVIS